MGGKLPLVIVVAAIAVVGAGLGGYLLFKNGKGRGSHDLSPDENHAPVAHAGLDRTVAPGEPVTLDGTLSTDADGDVLTFLWDLDDATDSDLDGDPGNDADLSGMVVEHTYPDDQVDRTYRAVLNVSDGKDNDLDTVQITVRVQKEEEPPVMNLSCRYTRPPLGLSGQYVITIDSVSRNEMLLNYSYALVGPGSEPIKEGGLIELLTAPPNATLRYLDLNPRYQDASAGDSITAKDVAEIPEGSVLEIFFKSFMDPVGAATLAKGQG